MNFIHSFQALARAVAVVESCDIKPIHQPTCHNAVQILSSSFWNPGPFDVQPDLQKTACNLTRQEYM